MPRKKTETAPLPEITVKCQTADRLPWGEILPLQGNLKSRTDTQIKKLCNVIIKKGWRFPLFVWKNGSKNFTLDGHGRLLACAELEKQGYAIPPLPVVYVEAKDKNEAKELILECLSRYGDITQEGYEEFSEGLTIEFSDLSIPEIHFEEMKVENIKEATYKEKIELIISCENEAQAGELYEEFTGRELKCKISTL